MDSGLWLNIPEPTSPIPMIAILEKGGFVVVVISMVVRLVSAVVPSVNVIFPRARKLSN